MASSTLRTAAGRAAQRRRVLESRAILRGAFTLVVVLAFAAVLHYTYKLQIAPQFSYSGLTYRSPDPVHYAVAIVAVITTTLALPQRIRRVSDFILWILFVIAAAPSILLAQYSKTLSHREATVMGIAVAVSMLAAITVKSLLPKTSLPIRRVSGGSGFWIFLACWSLVFYAYLLWKTGMQFRLLTFSDVYDVRADFGDAVGGSRGIGYLLPVQGNVINPLLVARGIYSRRYVPVVLGILGQIVIYSSTGHKSVLFSIIAFVGIALLFRSGTRFPGIRILIAITAASLSAFLLDRLSGSIVWSSLLVRRLMVVPGALTAAYVMVFDDRPKMNFSEIIPFVENPYEITRPVNIVGAEFVGNPETAANVNLFGHGYLNYGYLGMISAALFLGVMLVLADSSTRYLPTPVACIVFFAPAMSLASASVFTTLFTHGFAAAALLCAFAPGSGWGRARRARTRESRA